MEIFVFTVPMRNWNRSTISGLRLLFACFYSTYEELKHNNADGRSLLRACFYSTYEELKHTSLLLSYVSYILVFTVPMRNWNPFLCERQENVFLVFTVPMRNWNYNSSWTSKYIFLSFLQYLWGIETSPFSQLVIVDGKGFYSTYEELKHFCGCRLSDIMERFYSTYEELKHALAITGKPSKVGFLQYLWGIETFVVKLFKLVNIMFLQYLWGIETPLS